MDYESAKKTVAKPRLAAFVAGKRIPLTKWECLQWIAGSRARDARLTILATLASLEDVHSAVLIARFGEGLTLQKYGTRIGKSRERVRQMEAKALRIMRARLRDKAPALCDAMEIVPIPGGPFDPAWITTEQASELTDLTQSHIRWLCRTGRVVSRPYPHRRGFLAIKRETLKAYVLGHAPHGRRRGIWKGD